MNRSIAISTAVAGLLGWGVWQPEAKADTYISLNVRFNLKAKTQSSESSASSVGIGTKDLIQAIGAATGNNFSAKAALQLWFRVGGGVPFFVIHDGTNLVNASGYLIAGQIGEPVQDLMTGGNGTITGTVYVIEEFKLQNIPNWSFDVQGYNTAKQSNRGTGTDVLPAIGPTSLAITVAGLGTVGGKPAVFQGTVTASGRKVEQL